MSAWASSLFARANALSKSSRLRTGSDRSLTPNALAAASISVGPDLPSAPDYQRKATRATSGKASLSSSNRLPSRSGAMRAKSGDIPAWSCQAGDKPFSYWIVSRKANTIGIVTLAFLAAWSGGADGDDDIDLSGPVRLQGRAAVRLSRLHNGTQ